MAEKQTTPALYELTAITPAPSSVAVDVLTYNNLDAAIATQRPYENARYDEFYDAEPDSLSEEAKARALARLYMVMSAQRLVGSLNDTTRQLWSDRFTNAAIELYGQPDQELAKSIGSERARSLIEKAERAQIDPNLVARYRELVSSVGYDMAADRQEQKDFSETAAQIGEYLTRHYADVFDALALDGLPEVSSAEFVEASQRGVAVLAANHDQDWSGWSIELKADADKLTTFAKERRLVVNENRLPMSAQTANALFAHEILVHGLRGVNGRKLSEDQQTGLPGHLEAEEGMGKFVEYAITGKLPESADRYTDIALALGMIDGQKRTRQEMIDVVRTRLLLQNELKDDSEKRSVEAIQKSTLAQVNRIYRGTLGNHFVGVFTKDIAYFNGFLTMANYIEGEMMTGKEVGEIMDDIMQFKFDPTNERHVAEVERLKHEQDA
ncbi:MAG: tyrosine/phenylalanine carboxypeptidase domain-containing protein [Candidatus Saccharimonadales bacterium]